MKKVFALAAFIFLLTACGGSAAPAHTPDDVIAAFKAAGLEAETPKTMSAEDYGAAPMVGEGKRFFIPSMGENSGGRVVVCDDQADCDKLAEFYIEMGKESALLFSWVYTIDNTVVQINGSLDEDIAAQYEAALIDMN